ncbi:hypothetical protein A0H81_12218 [Grifola frondosa]|uniref:Uncharacterized protein n=1 Tax=Grifola frondosa TaxID=5627 RepID=A0A1C7LSR1_GRIFR|nr:hypothetical protein A0H81_12218 [Grifola frondosa]
MLRAWMLVLSQLQEPEKIGNRGLLAISAYLRNNTTLKELFLQNNAFFGDPEVTAAFTLALNSSCLETLSLTTNPQLSDTFIAHFLLSSTVHTFVKSISPF